MLILVGGWTHPPYLKSSQMGSFLQSRRFKKKNNLGNHRSLRTHRVGAVTRRQSIVNHHLVILSSGSARLPYQLCEFPIDFFYQLYALGPPWCHRLCTRMLCQVQISFQKIMVRIAVLCLIWRNKKTSIQSIHVSIYFILTRCCDHLHQKSFHGRCWPPYLI